MAGFESGSGSESPHWPVLLSWSVVAPPAGLTDHDSDTFQISAAVSRRTPVHTRLDSKSIEWRIESWSLSRRHFTKEFKLAAVRRLEQGVSIAEMAR